MSWLAHVLDCACRKRACPKNHLKHTHNTTTGQNKTVVHLEHWKNESRQGAIEIEVPQGQAMELFEMMEGAASFLGAEARGLVYSEESYNRYGMDSYEANYFSTLMKAWLSLPGMLVGFNQIRALWITVWNDYVDQAQMLPGDENAILLKEAAAALVGNSTHIWKGSYDARARSRGFGRVHAHYPAFVQFVRQQHAQNQATVARNPITGQLG